MFSSSSGSSGQVSAAQSEQGADLRSGSRSPGQLQSTSAIAAALQGLELSRSSSTRLPSVSMNPLSHLGPISPSLSPSSHSLTSPLFSPPSTPHSSPSPLSLLPPLPPSPVDYDLRVSAEEDFEQCPEADIYISSSMAGIGGKSIQGKRGCQL